MPQVVIAHPSDDSYGLDRVFLQAVDGLIAAGFDVTCMVETDNPGNGWVGRGLAARPVKVIRMPLAFLSRSRVRTPPAAVLWLARAAITAVRLIRRLRGSSVVYVNGFPLVVVAFAGRISGRPVLWHLHEVPPRPRVAGWVIRLLSTRQVCVSHAVAKALALDESPTCYVIHNGVAVADEPVRQETTEAGPVRIGIVARINRWKGHFVLADAFERLLALDLPVRLHIVGAAHRDAPDWEGRLRSRLSHLPQGCLTWAGEVESGTAYMRKLHILAAPSIEPDPFPLTVLEGMGNGLAVVASRIGGHPEAITDGINGLLVPVGDVEALTDALERLVVDIVLRADLGRRAFDDVRSSFTVLEFQRRIGCQVAALAARS